MTDLLTPIRSEHRCPSCSGAYLPVSHRPVVEQAAEGREEGPQLDPEHSPSAAVDLAALRSLIWYRGDLAGELA